MNQASYQLLHPAEIMLLHARLDSNQQPEDLESPALQIELQT